MSKSKRPRSRAKSDPVPLPGLLSRQYRSLRSIAERILVEHRAMQQAAGSDRMSPTSLVAEATLRLLLQKKEIRDADHLHGLAALSMQRSLTDRARRRGAKRRTPSAGNESATAASTTPEPDDSVRVALEALRRSKPRQAQIVALVGVKGLTISKAAAELGISVPTAERDLRAARLWLAQRLRS